MIKIMMMILFAVLLFTGILVNSQQPSYYDTYWRMQPHPQQQPLQQQFYHSQQPMYRSPSQHSMFSHSSVQTRQAEPMSSEPIIAIAKLQGEGVSGVVQFNTMQGTSQIQVSGKITGLSPGHHGFHIHQFGDTRDGCKSMGGHYNPEGHNHGSRSDQVRHVGDLGNIEADENGVAEFNFADHKIALSGAHSILGRGVVVHAKQDDLGRGGVEDSLKTGNAGGRVACGIVATAKQ